MERKIRTAVVGCGKVGHFHAKAYRALPGCELVAAYNVRLGRAEAFGREYGIPAYDSFTQMVEETGVEAVSICTPHPAHKQAAVLAANQGLHVAIEKPLASSLLDCDEMIAAVNATGVKGATICQRRFYPSAQRVKAAIDAGKLGRPILGTVNMLGWRDMAYYGSDPWRGSWENEGGGVLVNQAPHQLDLLLWYMGDIAELYGMWDTLNHPGLAVEDTAVAAIRFKNGGLGSIVVSNSQNPALFGQVQVHGGNGASVGVQTDGGAMFIAGMSGITEPPFNHIWTIPGEEANIDAWRAEDAALFALDDSIYEFHIRQLGDFIAAIREDREPAVTLQDGRKTVELFTAIYRSRRDKRPQYFPLDAGDNRDFDGRTKRY